MPPDFLQVSTSSLNLRIFCLRSNNFQMGLNERAESRFVWNKFLLQPFQSQNLKSYCLPLMHGCKLFSFFNGIRIVMGFPYSRRDQSAKHQ